MTNKPFQDIEGIKRYEYDPLAKDAGKRKNPFVVSAIDQAPRLPMEIGEVDEWKDFEKYIGHVDERKNAVLTDDKKLKEQGSRVRRNAYSKYDTSNTRELVSLFGRRNLAVKHKPDWSSGPSADAWLENKKKQAKTDKAKNYWGRWGVKETNLNLNPNMADNVIPFDDVVHGKVKAIDGYHFIPFERKEQQRLFYSAIPTATDRKKIPTEEKNRLKQYYRKYPTLDKQNSHPISDFVPTISPFAVVRKAISNFLKGAGLGIYSQKNQQGNLTPAHYMTLLQRVSSKAYQLAVKYYMKLPQNYNFEEDPAKIKFKRNQKILFSAFAEQTQEGVWILLLLNRFLKNIAEILNQERIRINTAAKGDVLKWNYDENEWKKNPPVLHIINIVDEDLVERKTNAANPLVFLGKDDINSGVRSVFKRYTDKNTVRKGERVESDDEDDDEEMVKEKEDK
jgi:hypothetical protein